MKSVLLTGLLLYIGTGFYLYLVQRSFIYFPVQVTQSYLPEMVFVNDGHSIKVSILNQENRKAIIYFGGNAEIVDFNAEDFSKLFPEHTVYLVKYRGYGGSTGTPSEEAIYSDAIHIYDVIKDRHDEISLIGRSLGSAVATYVASGREIEKLVLITPFDSIQNIAQSQFPIYPMSILLKDKYDSYSRANGIKAETMVIAAENDKIIKMSHTRRLIEGFSSDVLLHVIEGTGHNDISYNPRYYFVLGDFL
jgi:pimeloyl-ACP methyl ester carboxylesterase